MSANKIEVVRVETKETEDKCTNPSQEVMTFWIGIPRNRGRKKCNKSRYVKGAFDIISLI